MTDMQGGDLEVLQMADARGGVFDELKKKGVPLELCEAVKYPGAGYGCFMQGSKILHRVSPVISGREPRISLVNSYSHEDVFMPDSTRYSTFVNWDPANIHPIEFARLKAWRIMGRLKYILDECSFGEDPQTLADIMQEAGAELARSSRLLRQDERDDIEFLAHGKLGSGGVSGAPRSKL
mmetsp:Transcript_35743/g.83022  ORF Transcript_35743/g.83022 Transcript_35743/m.83022 type:complete len:180 (+) Transcript_35743:35-574(+)